MAVRDCWVGLLIGEDDGDVDSSGGNIGGLDHDNNNNIKNDKNE